MKKALFSFLALFAFALISTAQVFTESFDYTIGSTLDSNGWNAHSGTSGPISVDAASLTFTQYSPTAIGGSAVSAGTSQDVNVNFGEITSGDVYASFLLKIDSIGSDGYFFHFMEDVLPSFAFRARTFFRQDADNPNAFNLGLTFNSSTGDYDTTEFAFGSTILVVAKYSIVPGIDNDSVSLYAFDANGSFATEPATPLIGPSGGTASDVNPARIALRQFSGNGGFTVDAFSINTVWDMSPTFTLNQISLPISFDDPTVDYGVTDFGGNSSMVVPNPTNASNNVLMSTKGSAAATWAGTTFGYDSSAFAMGIPFSAGNTVMKVAVWSPDANTIIRLKAEDKTNAGISVETEATTTVAMAWDTLSFDFANQATGTAAINFANTYDKLSIFYNFGTDGATAGQKTYYCDDVRFVGGSGSTIAQIDLPITWDDTSNVDYTTVDFGGNTSMVVVSPTLSTNNVLQAIKGANSQPWAGTTLSTNNGLASAIPFSSGNTEMKVAVWSPDSGTVVRLKVEDKTNGAISVETEAITGAAATWDTLTFDFTNNAANTPAINFASTYDKVSIFFGFGTVYTAPKTFYCDNVWFTGTSGPPPSNNSPYCNTQAFHFSNPAEVASSIFLTVKNTGSNSMEVVIESATSDPVDDLIIAGAAGGGAISAIDTPATGQLRRIITWAGATPPTVDFNVLWSKLTFGGNWQLLQSGNLAIPFMATCPTPTKAIIDLPITWDDTANVDYTITDFEGNSSMHVVDPTNSSNMVLMSTKTSGGQPWAGTTLSIDSVGLATAIPFSPGNTEISVAIWSPDANIPVRLKAEDKTDPTKSVETEVMTMVAGAWDTLVFDFANQAPNTSPINFTYTYDKLSIFYDFLTAPATPAKSYYCDDVFFGGGTPPPPALAQIDLPITWDDTANVDYTVTDFEGNASMLVVDPTNASNMVLMSTKTSGGQPWAGTTLSIDTTGLATAIPFSPGNTEISVAVWSPDANIPVRLKAEDKTDPTKSVETEVMTMVAGAWDTLVFDFANQATGTAAIDFTYTYDKLSIFYDFLTAPATPAKSYYCDDVFFGNGTPPPTLAQIDLPITWDDTANVDYTVTDFEGNSSMHVVDPTNASNMVLMSTKTSGGQPWAGTTLSVDSSGLATAIPFSPGNTLISVAVWSPDANIPVRLKAEDKTDPTKSVETEAMVMVAGVWDTLVFDFANQAAGTAAIDFTYTYDKLSIFYDFLTAPATPAKSYYCDDVFFGGGSTPPANANVTFQVDLSDYTGSYTEVNLNGSFNNWCGSCAVMTDANNDSIFEITVSIPANDTSEFKYTLDGWTVDEQLTQGDPCTKTTVDASGTFTNRFIVPTADTTLPAVCWESCSACSGIGIDEDVWSEALTVSPNPSTGVFNISGALKVTTNVEIIITNVQGQVLYHANDTRSSLDQNISLENAPNGMYMVNVITDYGMTSEKIVISK